MSSWLIVRHSKYVYSCDDICHQYETRATNTSMIKGFLRYYNEFYRTRAYGKFIVFESLRVV